MITEYKIKAFLCANIVEIYRYSMIQRRGLPSGNSNPGARSENVEKTSSSIGRSKKTVRRLINSNPDLKKFYTLTFRENECDLDNAHRLFKQFMVKMKRRYPGMKYVAVPEFQKRGAVHYHFLCNLRFVRVEKISKIWGNGYIWINRATNLKNVGGYLMKYMRKEMDDERLYGRRTYLFSLNLEKPVELLDENVEKYLKMMGTDLKEISHFTFSTPISEVKFSMLCRVSKK